MFWCSMPTLTFRMGVVYNIPYIRLYMVRAFAFPLKIAKDLE